MILWLYFISCAIAFAITFRFILRAWYGDFGPNLDSTEFFGGILISVLFGLCLCWFGPISLIGLFIHSQSHRITSSGHLDSIVVKLAGESSRDKQERKDEKIRDQKLMIERLERELLEHA